MSLTLYNTLSKKKESFEPLTPGEVKMYVCGPTVYNFLHIGNFRGPIFFNLVRNWLEKEGFEVTYVYNYTDVDDKIIQRANEENVEASVISEKYIQEFEKDFLSLGLTPHEHNPRVTEFIPQIIQFIEKLLEKEKAYLVEGEVFYSIESFADYGKLSGNKLDELEAGKRVEVDQRKRNPYDFVLWKPSKNNEPAWDSPWGKGRPGWHIECSAMIQEILGESIDIHGGGIDLIFPHHECEIAQGEGRTNKKYCGYWMHNNFLNMNDEKMSKSLGNIITARNFNQKYHPEILKYLMLCQHYRTHFNVNQEQINRVIRELSRAYSALKLAQELITEETKADPSLIKKIEEADCGIKKALNDDFNTPEMFAYIFDVIRHFNGLKLTKKKNPQVQASAQLFFHWLKNWGKLMALFQETPQEFLKTLDDIYLQENKIERSFVEGLTQERDQARQNKDFGRSDEIRDELNKLGIEVMDSPEGSVWSVKK